MLRQESSIKRFVKAMTTPLKATKQQIVQDWGCDALLEKIKSEIKSVDEIKEKIADAFQKGKKEILLWSVKEVLFKPSLLIEGMDCRLEKFRDTKMTVEEAAIAEGAHSSIITTLGAELAVSDILSSPDLLPLVGAYYGENISCNHYIVDCGGETDYWIPKEHQLFLYLWTDGLPSEKINARQKALANHKERYFTLQITSCYHCMNPVFASNMYALNTNQGDLLFCSLDCITHWQNALD